MTATDVIEILECLKGAGIRVYVDGGWGVDALLGEETRKHSDLDLALDAGDLDAAWQALGERGFKHDQTSEPGLPARLVLRDERRRQVDLHPLFSMSKGMVGSSFPEPGEPGVATPRLIWTRWA